MNRLRYEKQFESTCFVKIRLTGNIVEMMLASMPKRFALLPAIAFMVSMFFLGVSPANADTPPTGIYASDDSGVVEYYDTNGVGSVFARTGYTTIGVAFDESGDLFAVDYYTHSLWEFQTNGTGSVITTNLSNPWAMVMDGSGNLFITDYDFGKIWKCTTNGVLSLFASNNLVRPDGLAFDRAGNLYVANYESANAILKFTPDGASTVFSTNVTGASGMAFDSAGFLYVADYDNNQVWKVGTNGVGSIFVTNNLNLAESVAFDVEGNLYVANNGDGTVASFDTNGNSSLLTAPGDKLVGAEFIATWPIPDQLIPPVAALTFSSLLMTNNQFQFLVSGPANANFILEATTNLASPAWIPLITNTVPFAYTETNAFAQRFYRAITP